MTSKVFTLFAAPLQKGKPNTGTHVGFSEDRGPNFRKRANQYKRNKKRI